MTTTNWIQVLDQAAAMRVKTVQFIGGEPTLHPGFPELVQHALGRDLEVEIYTNLVHVSEGLWKTFAQPRVSLATSYYSDDPREHAAITGRPSYLRTKTNIAEAIRRGIPLRAGVIDLGGGQRAAQAKNDLVDLGVPVIDYDMLRQVGRGVRDQHAGIDQLCGRCGNGVAAISPDGDVWPCVFSRWLPIGNVLEVELAQIVSSAQADEIRASLKQAFHGRANTNGTRACQPNCSPICNPINCGPGASR